MNTDQMVTYLKKEIAESIHEDPDNIDPSQHFLRMGISSLQALKMIARIKKQLEIELNPVVLLECNNIIEFAEYLVGCDVKNISA